MFLWSRARPVRKADNLTAICEHFNWELLDHPSCSPDLVSVDYHLFTYLKKWLQHFNEEMIEGMKT
jgi:hypothetical protein